MVLRGSTSIWAIPKSSALWATKGSVLLNILMDADLQGTPDWISERILGILLLLSSVLIQPHSITNLPSLDL